MSWGVDVAQRDSGHAIDHNERRGVVERAETAHKDALRLVAGSVATGICHGKTGGETGEGVGGVGNGTVLERSGAYG